MSPEKAANLQRARDLIASGRGWSEVGRMFGIKESALRMRAKREGWYVPKQAGPIPPPPPPVARVLQGQPDACAPPFPAAKGDFLQYGREIFEYCLRQVFQASPTKEDCWRVIRELPRALKDMASLPDPKPDDTKTDLVVEIERRLAEVSRLARPDLTGDDFHRGEIPDVPPEGLG